MPLVPGSGRSIATTIARWLMLLPLALQLHVPANARPLAQYQHRAFTAADGVPETLVAITQDSDGMLWLGATTGIYTFDGQRFTRQPVEFRTGPRQPYFMAADRSGGVWIGWIGGGITVVRAGAVQHYDSTQGIPDGTIWGFTTDPAGAVWASGQRGVARFDGHRWQQMGPAEGFDAPNAMAVAVDRDENVGVFTDKGVYVLRKGAPRFDPPVGTMTTRQPPARGPNGEMYFMDKAGIRRIASLPRYDQPDFPYLYRQPGETTRNFLADRDGGLWFDSKDAVHRIARPEATYPMAGGVRSDAETMPNAAGLSGNVIHAMIEDDRGDIWMATSGGLDRFKPIDLVDIGKLTGENLSEPTVIPTGTDGGMWIRTFSPRPAWFRLDAAGTIVARYYGELRGVAFASGDALVTIDAASRRIVTLQDGVQRLSGPQLPDGRVNLIARDAGGILWVTLADGRVLRGDGSAWTPVAGLPTARVTALRLEPDGVVWLGYIDNRLVRLKGGRATHYGAAQGLSAGSVASILRIGTTLWIAGASGLNTFKDGKFSRVGSAPGMFDYLTGAMQDRRGGMWLMGRTGLMYLSAAQLVACAAACPAVTTPMLFDNADGLKGRSAGMRDGYLAQDAQDRIWAATGTGIYRYDGKTASAAPAAPRPLVTGLASAGQHYATTAPVVLAPGNHELQIDYTAPMPDMPERARFRYRLAGYDSACHEAGARRQAFYTGLAPGNYRFDVMAAQGNSAWSAPATLAIAIRPDWYQTWWFRGVSLLALAALLALAYRARVARLTRRVREQETARQHERERIARELHDTVLQTNFALLLQVRAVAATAAGNPLADQLDAIVGQAQTSLAEGRDKIAGLRAQQDGDMSLDALLEQLAAGILRGSPIALSCTCRGRPWPLGDTVTAECLAIATEAVTNACKHSRGHALSIGVRYRMRSCIITIADNGRGIAAEHLAGRIGHWGLAGMRERATLIKAKFDLRTGTNGTTVTLCIKRRHA